MDFTKIQNSHERKSGLKSCNLCAFSWCLHNGTPYHWNGGGEPGCASQTPNCWRTWAINCIVTIFMHLTWRDFTNGPGNINTACINNDLMTINKDWSQNGTTQKLSGNLVRYIDVHLLTRFNKKQISIDLMLVFALEKKLHFDYYTTVFMPNVGVIKTYTFENRRFRRL